MENLLPDLLANMQAYYYGFVALLPKLGLAFLIMGLMVFIARAVRQFTHKRLAKRMDDPLLARFISNLVGMAVNIAAVLLALSIVGLGGVAVGILSTAGLGAFVLGFAFKDIGENFLAGIVLAFNRPFRIGDTVELGGYRGQVVALNLRDTQLKTSEGKDIFIPNSNVVKNPVVNDSLGGFLRDEFTIHLNYSADLEKALALMQQVLERSEDILHQEGRLPDVIYGPMSPTTISLVVRYWRNTFTTTVPDTTMKQRLFDRMQAALKEADIALPADLSEVTAKKLQKNTDN